MLSRMRGPRARDRFPFGFAWAAGACLASSAEAQDVTLDAELPSDGPRHVYVDLEVPPATSGASGPSCGSTAIPGWSRATFG